MPNSDEHTQVAGTLTNLYLAETALNEVLIVMAQAGQMSGDESNV